MASSVPETLTKMKRQHTYRREKDRIGAQGCIYCNGPAPLTLEHIIPENIGGMLTIERASCAFCADETGAFEGHACLGMLPMRRQMRFPQKRRGAKDRERRKAERFVLMLDNNRVKVPIEEFPALLMSLVFPFPGILLGQKPEDKPLTGGVYSAELVEGFGEKLNRVKAKYRANSIGTMGIEPRKRGEEDDYGTRCLPRLATHMQQLQLGCGNFHTVSCAPGVRIWLLKPYCHPIFIGIPGLETIALCPERSA